MSFKDGNGLFVVDEEGRLFFTKRGKEELSGLFQLANIDMDEIRNFDDYTAARAKAAPYFGEWLESYCAHFPDTREYRMLKAALRGEPY